MFAANLADFCGATRSISDRNSPPECAIISLVDSAQTLSLSVIYLKCPHVKKRSETGLALRSFMSTKELAVSASLSFPDPVEISSLLNGKEVAAARSYTGDDI